MPFLQMKSLQNDVSALSDRESGKLLDRLKRFRVDSRSRLHTAMAATVCLLMRAYGPGFFTIQRQLHTCPNPISHTVWEVRVQRRTALAQADHDEGSGPAHLPLSATG
jgi:hypothetical protein